MRVLDFGEKIQRKLAAEQQARRSIASTRWRRVIR